MTTTTMDPTEQRAASFDLTLVACTVAAIAATAGATWWATRLGGETLSMLVAVITAAVGATIVNLLGRRSGRRARRIAVTLTLAVGGVLLVLAMSGALTRAKVGALLPTWTAEAERLLAEPATVPPRACTSDPVNPPQLAGFGRVDEWCVSRGSQRSSVAFHQRDPMGGSTGLLYSPGGTEPNVMSQCVAHLDGPWWQTASADTDCPGGFTFVGGG